ncbi:16S rRNA (guanine(966)-N(2))-methyltransferase RsmD [Desulfitispora alkaliphila]|uniref:16S rRNA (guanine(966)-N(2))-methyltransferase RsmD n=1 Tax=Desulfitispora alkaliphila TaxID=622674 RepID=UPI003D1BBF96
MRIISGQARGFRLKAPKGTKTRPTSDRVKEALFNIMMDDIKGSNWLDLYAGSGGIGIEALSRGAQSVLFIEQANEAIKIINENLKGSKLIGGKVVKQDVLNFLAKDNPSSMFDVIFLDPPYNSVTTEKTLQLIQHNKWLKNNGTTVFEASKGEALPERVDNLFLYRIKNYGDTTLNFFKYSG